MKIFFLLASIAFATIKTVDIPYNSRTMQRDITEKARENNAISFKAFHVEGDTFTTVVTYEVEVDSNPLTRGGQ